MRPPKSTFTAHAADPSLDACAAEPIRIPGGIQPHGALVVLDAAGGQVLQASENVAAFLGLRDANDPALIEALHAAGWRGADHGGFASGPLAMTLPAGAFQVSTHITAQGLVLEFEAAATDMALDGLYPRVRRVLDRISDAVGIADIAQVAIEELHALTGFNRVLLYSFGPEGDGTVLAESTDGLLPSYLDLRFPAADIPAQARELYKLNRIRLIPNADYRAARLTPSNSPIDGAPLDLSHAALRSVSPVHLEYMRNMGTLASMSLSILVDGELWGLISAHHRTPREIGPQVRAACDHIGQLVSLQIAARERASRTAERLRLSELRTELLTHLAASDDWMAGLLAHPNLWRDLAGGAGAALVRGADVLTVGATPEPGAIAKLAAQLWRQGKRQVFADDVDQVWSGLASDPAVASGLAAIAISQLHPDYLMWFRPEVIRTVSWAGEPAKPVEQGDRLHPRQSFELWKQQVRGRAVAWSAEEVESVAAFSTAIQAFVLRRAEERAELSSQLAATNEELESFSYSISHDLRAPFRHVVGYAELLADHSRDTLDDTARRYLANIKDSALSAGRLVDDLLSFSQLGRNSLKRDVIDMSRLAADVCRSLGGEPTPNRVEWSIGPLPQAWGDAAMIRQVLYNLIQNAIKYSAGAARPQISVTGEDLAGATRYRIADNGVGFDMAYGHKLFQVFQRLHRVEDFEGTGIGLALVRRIIERHGGQVRGEGEPGHGAAFTFELPKSRTHAPGDRELG